jgi:hypothetical protein
MFAAQACAFMSKAQPRITGIEESLKSPAHRQAAMCEIAPSDAATECSCFPAPPIWVINKGATQGDDVGAANAPPFP